MGKSKTPPAPDYAAAAKQQGADNLVASQQTAALNRPNQIDPNGSQSWSLKEGADQKNPQPGDWIVTNKLNATQQGLKDQQDALSGQFGTLAQGALTSVGNTMSQKFDTSGLPQWQSMGGAADGRYVDTANGMPQYATAGNAQPMQRLGNQQQAGTLDLASMPTAQQFQPNGVPAAQYSMGRANTASGIGGNGSPNFTQVGSPTNYQTAPDMQGRGQIQSQQGTERLAPVNYMAGGLARGSIDASVNTPTTPTDRSSLSTDGLSGFGTATSSTGDSRQRITDAMYNRQASLLNPQTQQQNSDLTSRLAAQGITEGSAAYNRAMSNTARDQSEAYARARDSAIMAGGAEESRINSDNLAAAQFANATRGQQFNERGAVAGFNNSNLDTTFNQDMTAAQFQQMQNQQRFSNELSQQGFNNQVNSQDQAASFNQRLTTAGANNAAAGQDFSQEFQRIGQGNSNADASFAQGLAKSNFNAGQDQNRFQNNVAAAGFNNSAGQQGFTNRLSETAANNSAAGQNFQQGLQQAGFNNTAGNQTFQQQMQQAGFNNDASGANIQRTLAALGLNNQAIGQNYQQALGQVGINNAAAQQDFTNQVTGAGFNNDQIARAWQDKLTGTGFNNSVQNQNFNQNLSQTNANNTLHQNAVAEALMQRQLGMNEANALRTGVQMGGMNFQQFGGAGQVQAGDHQGAVNQQYQAQVAANNANNANNAGAWKGITGLAGTAMTQPWLFSDRRLKTDIKRIGTHSLGIGWYSWTYQKCALAGQEACGVMADEVATVMPQAVLKNADGYSMVNYSLVGGYNGGK